MKVGKLGTMNIDFTDVYDQEDDIYTVLVRITTPPTVVEELFRLQVAGTRVNWALLIGVAAAVVLLITTVAVIKRNQTRSRGHKEPVA